MSDVSSASTRSTDERDAATVAAVDLGSNSFHLIVARFAGSRLMVVDRLKDMVRMAAGLDANNKLGDDVMDRALTTLSRFRQRLQDIPPENIRVVGTNTLRKARNGDAFVARARKALGHEIEIISGREEARLIYLGVSHDLEGNLDRRLVVDIGGGSTEVILGRQFQPEQMESLFMGCVGMSREFFADGSITPAAMKAAELAARQELEPIESVYRKRGWDSAIGASGTILAVQEVITAAGWARGVITADALKALRRRIVEFDHVDRLSLPGLPKQRAAVFPGGVAILSALFKSLRIERMQTSGGALREGLLWDLLGRRHQADIRERTVEDLARRYHVDEVHAQRVTDTALDLLAAARDAWPLEGSGYDDLLRWAAHLHEIGMDIAHSQYHKHGSYLLQHMDMPGFSRNEQRRIAMLVRSHRRKYPSAEIAEQQLGREATLRRLSLLLRCAVVMHRSRSARQTPPLYAVQAEDDGLHLVFPERWLRDHAMTRLDLAEEASVWASEGVALTFSEVGQIAPPDVMRKTLGG